jgi:2-polyprenyl-6-methoxyphenol hydroxylase-like FAD-dependent oxidoreductase
MSDEPFKVAIVGGGYTGLATALHLEILGIDWVLIEAHDVIAPQLGASIGLAPNGMAIIDQLGCLEDVEKRSTACRSAQMRNGEGKVMYSFAVDPIRQIHGYDLTFTERRIVLEIFYDHIKSKDKIFTGQKVQSIEHTKDGVEIYTQEGHTFTADLVVGADGIHSHVRGQMWKAAWNDGSTAFSRQIGQGKQWPLYTGIFYFLYLC